MPENDIYTSDANGSFLLTNGFTSCKLSLLAAFSCRLLMSGVIRPLTDRVITKRFVIT